MEERIRVAPLERIRKENNNTTEQHSLTMSNRGVIDKDREYKPTNKNTSQERPKFQFSIAQWNGRSINTASKINYIKGFKSNIIALQQIWQRGDDIAANFETIDIVERTVQQGGGTATIRDKFPSYTVQKRIEINKDTVLLRINFSNNYMWFVNTYLRGGTIAKLQKLFGKIQKNVPSNEVSQMIMIGDFNIDLKDTEDNTYKLLQKLCKEIGVKIESPGRYTREGAILDYIICGRNIHIQKGEIVKKSPSDHAAIR